MKVLVLDNFDSFVYNIAQYIGALGATPVVVRSDQPVSVLRSVGADALVVSPGPGRPEDAGVSVEAIQQFHGEIPIFGVCLGHQAIAVAFGGSVVRAERVMHGKTSEILHGGEGVLSGMKNPFRATRYHSLVVEKASLPPGLSVTAHTSDGVVMAIRHNEGLIEGVQFHPESVLTEDGMRLIGNFLRR